MLLLTLLIDKTIESTLNRVFKIVVCFTWLIPKV